MYGFVPRGTPDDWSVGLEMVFPIKLATDFPSCCGILIAKSRSLVAMREEVE